MAETPWEFLTVTSTQSGPSELGGMTVMEVSDWETIWPAPAEPNVTEVALAKPPPEIVMAPPPPIGPVLGLTEATEGHPSAPCSAMERFWSMGVPRPLAASKPATGREVARVACR